MMRAAAIVLWAVCLSVLGARSAAAHPLGNFTINHLARIRRECDGASRALRARHRRDPNLSNHARRRRVDAGAHARVGERRGRVCRRRSSVTFKRPRASASLRARLGASAAGRRRTADSLLDRRLRCAASRNAQSSVTDLVYADRRIGWKDIVLPGLTDPTNELRSYPSALIGSPRHNDRATFDVDDGRISHVRVAATTNIAGGPTRSCVLRRSPIWSRAKIRRRSGFCSRCSQRSGSARCTDSNRATVKRCWRSRWSARARRSSRPRSSLLHSPSPTRSRSFCSACSFFCSRLRDREPLHMDHAPLGRSPSRSSARAAFASRSSIPSRTGTATNTIIATITPHGPLTRNPRLRATALSQRCRRCDERRHRAMSRGNRRAAHGAAPASRRLRTSADRDLQSWFGDRSQRARLRRRSRCCVARAALRHSRALRESHPSYTAAVISTIGSVMLAQGLTAQGIAISVPAAVVAALFAIVLFACFPASITTRSAHRSLVAKETP